MTRYLYATSLMNSIAIVGGNGFLGRKICEVGVRLGWSVTSLSRSGKPPSPVSYLDNAWISKVQWTRADLFEPDTYKKHLAGKTAVVHSVGILFENQSYKQTINSNFNFLNDIQKLGNMMQGPNPMERDSKQTYEAIQRDLAVLLADAYLEELGSEAKPTFVYISADNKPPIVPDGYITSKREAEFELSCKEGLRSILMRPGIMYDENEPISNNRKLFSKFLDLGYKVKSNVLGHGIPGLDALVRPPVSTEKVALKIFEKIEDPTFSGVVLLEEIAKF